jgi:translation elongation factor EF-Tu-like GTPase
MEGDKGLLGEEAIMKLADHWTPTFPMPKRAVDGAFLMPVEDVFSISARHRRDRPCRARYCQSRRRNRNRWYC